MARIPPCDEGFDALLGLGGTVLESRRKLVRWSPSHKIILIKGPGGATQVNIRSHSDHGRSLLTPLTPAPNYIHLFREGTPIST
jgi:hypothetical protein